MAAAIVTIDEITKSDTVATDLEATTTNNYINYSKYKISTYNPI